MCVFIGETMQIFAWASLSDEINQTSNCDFYSGIMCCLQINYYKCVHFRNVSDGHRRRRGDT